MPEVLTSVVTKELEYKKPFPPVLPCVWGHALFPRYAPVFITLSWAMSKLVAS